MQNCRPITRRLEQQILQHWRRISQQSCKQATTQIIASNTNAESASTKMSSYLSSISAEWEQAKPFKAIPGPSTFQLVRGYMKGGEFEKVSFIELLAKCRQKYGDIFLLPRIGQQPIVSIFDPVDFERVHRTEGKYPHRPGTEAMTYYREQRRDGFFKDTIGLAASNEEWGDFRSKVNPVLMKTQNAKLYLDPLMRVNEEFAQHIRDIRDPITLEVPNNFFHNITCLTFESVAVVALDKHLGLIRSKELGKDTQKLFDCLHIFIESIYDLGIKPGFYRYFRTPTYRRFERAMDNIFKIIREFVDETLERLERNGGVSETNSVFQQLLKIDRNVAILMAIDMIQGGVETTSSILCGAMLLIAKHPEKQTKLRTEILNALSQDKNGQFTYENTQHLPYLRACIKEAIRIYPLTAGNFRTAGNNIVLSGYRIPKGTNVVLNTNMLLSEERYYPRAKEFIPERWLRGDDASNLVAENISPFVYLPFGFGPRTCVGKRIVNLEMELVLANLVKNFNMEFNYPTENAFKCKFINYPAIPLTIKFKDL